MRSLRVALAVAFAVLLAACVAQPVRELPPGARAAAQQAQAARASILAAHPRWTLQGRVALAKGHNGGSGRIDWRQDGGRFEVALSAPVTRQSWRLTGDELGARLDGLDGGPREGADAQTLLHDATGWTIPVAALAEWVRGAPDARSGPAKVEYGIDGRLARLQQAGWTIDYDDWRPEPDLGVELPHRLDATRDDARVRLVIDHWQEGIAGS